MVRCPNCGKENQPHHKFCLGCGRAIEVADTYIDESPTLSNAAAAAAEAVAAAKHDTRSCPSCGNAVTAGFGFCGKCGARLDRSPTSRQSQVREAAASVPTGRLTLLRPDGTEGAYVSLSEGATPVGRGLGPLFDHDMFLSPRHAELVLTGSGLLVRDVGSLNGVYLRLRGEEVELISGDQFRIGQQLLRFETMETMRDDDDIVTLGSPSNHYWGRIHSVLTPDVDGMIYPLVGDAMVLGRERGEVIFPDDGYVSGAHARISTRGGRFYLADMNSSNGTFVRIRSEHVVESGGALLLGQQLFRVTYATSPAR